MRLTGRIVEVHSGANFTDGLQRVSIRVAGADSLYRDIRLVNTEGWHLDEVVVFELVVSHVGAVFQPDNFPRVEPLALETGRG